jgi:tetratricopeptide (TPR) repeat protein
MTALLISTAVIVIGIPVWLWLRIVNIEKNIKSCTGEINENPQDADPYLRRGRLFLKKMEYENALTDLNKAIELSPENPEAYKYRANVYKALNQPVNERKDRNQVNVLTYKNLFKKNTELVNSLGHSANDENKRKELLEAMPDLLNTLLELTGDISYGNAIIKACTDLLSSLGNSDTDLQKRINFLKARSQALFRLSKITGDGSQAYAASSDLREVARLHLLEALRLFDEALKQDPFKLEAMRARLQCLIKLEQYSKALEDFPKVLNMYAGISGKNTQYGEIICERAQVYICLGDYLNALNDCLYALDFKVTTWTEPFKKSIGMIVQFFLEPAKNTQSQKEITPTDCSLAIGILNNMLEKRHGDQTILQARDAIINLLKQLENNPLKNQA